MKVSVRLIALLASVSWTTAGLAEEASFERGRQVYERWCVHCHGRATHLPGTSALAVKYQGKVPAALEDRTDLTQDAIRAFVRQGAFAMAPFRKTEIDDAELEALAAYLSDSRQ